MATLSIEPVPDPSHRTKTKLPIAAFRFNAIVQEIIMDVILA